MMFYYFELRNKPYPIEVKLKVQPVQTVITQSPTSVFGDSGVEDTGGRTGRNACNQSQIMLFYDESFRTDNITYT